MICKYCNLENPDGAVYCAGCGKRLDGKFRCPTCGKMNEEGAAFCAHCGKRLDGKFCCPSCGKMNEEGTAFCAHCGKRLDGKTECPFCKTIYEGRFCPSCGRSALDDKKETKRPSDQPGEKGSEPDKTTFKRTSEQARPLFREPSVPYAAKSLPAPPVSRTAPSPAVRSDPAVAEPKPAAPLSPSSVQSAPEKSAEKPEKWKKICLLISGALGMCTAAIALLFSLLIGWETTASEGADLSSQFGYNFSKQNIFYYFYQGYADLGNLFGNANVPFFAKLSYYFPVVLGTVISSVTILAVLVYSIKTAIQYTRYMRGFSAKGVEKLACNTYFAYLTGSVALLALRYFSFTDGGSFSLSLQLNGATVAGIVIGGICVAAFLGLSAAARGKELLKQTVLTELICSTIGIVLLLVLVGLSATAGGTYFSGSNETTVSFPMLMQTLGNRNDADWLGFFYCFAAYSLLMVLLLIAVGELLARMRSFYEKSTANIVRSCAVFVLGIAFVVFSVLAINRFADCAGGEKSYGSIIAVAVFLVLNFARAITQTALQAQRK